MSIVYPVKRVFRSWRLFTALLIGIALAATFFACVDIKANISAQQSLNQQLSSVNTDLDYTAWLNYTQINQAFSNITNISGVKNVDTIVRSNSAPVMDYDTNYTSYLQLVSFSDTSPIYNEWINNPAGGIGENQTYVVLGTPMASKVKIGDNITAQMSFPTPNQGNWNTFWVNLTVAGFADLTDKGYSLAAGDEYIISPGGPVSSQQFYNVRSNMLIIGWDSTFLKIWSGMGNRTVQTTFMIDIDRAKLISPWNIDASITNVDTVAKDVQYNVLSQHQTYGYVNNYLDNALNTFKRNFQPTLTEFVVLSIPIFFVSWYLGSTVSDVSFNMRRREIGLLSTKGLSSGQTQRMFLGEAVTVGLIGGVAGVVGGLVMNQVLLGKFDVNTLFNPTTFSPYTMIFTVVFGVAIGLVSMFWSARKASKIPTVEALREYVDSSKQPYHKLPPWVATALGTYKIIVLLLAINVPTAISNYSSGEFYLAVLQTPLTYFDLFLTYFGPLLFFWGITKLLIQNSQLFARLAAQFSRVMGDFGALAAKNVRRNPARVAAIAFLIAFIIGYGVQVTGQTASQQDYLVRQVKYSVGADISIGVSNSSDAPRLVQDLLANVTGIQSSTIVSTLNQYQAGTTVETIDPASFLKTAYYEDDWFSGASVQQMFHELETDNQTIILLQSIAQQQNLKVGDSIAIDFQSGARTLRIVGLFGPQLPKDELSTSTSYGETPTPVGEFIPTELNPTEPYMASWSYIPRNLFNMTYGSGIYQAESFDTTILLKLNPGVNGTTVADQIRNMKLDIDGVTSFSEQWQQSQNSQDQSTFYTLQVLDFQNLSVVFAVLSASVGMALIAIVSLSERSREATLMSVRGVSYRQLVWMFLAENLAVITFSVVLGLAGGYVIDRGTILAANVGTLQLIYPHVIFPTSTLITIAFYVGLIYASAIVAILVMSIRYVTKLERMVRTK